MASSFINSLADASYRSLDAYAPATINDGSQGLAKMANKNTRTSNTSNANNSNFDYSQAGMKTQESAIKEASGKVKDQALTQEDFLLLLTTQLQAQDPTKPADNNQLVTQMSQLSMVESLNSINSNMDNVLSQVGTSAAMNATNLIGTYVYTNQPNGYFGGSPSAPAVWAVDAGDEVYSDIQLTIKNANTGEIVYKDNANSLTGEIKYGWPGILSPDGPIKDTPEGDGGTDDNKPPTGDGENNNNGITNSLSKADESGDGEGDKDQDTIPWTEIKPQYEYCNAGNYVIEVTGKNSAGQTVNIPVKGLGFVSSVSLGKTLSDTMLNLNGLGELPFDKANRVTL